LAEGGGNKREGRNSHPGTIWRGGPGRPDLNRSDQVNNKKAKKKKGFTKDPGGGEDTSWGKNLNNP